MPRFRFALLAPIFLASAPLLDAQALPFTLRAVQGSTSQALADGGTILFPADAIGRPADAGLTVTYRGTGSSVMSFAEIAGSSDFIITGLPDSATVFTQNQAFNMSIRFLPTTSTRVTGSIRFTYVETPPVPPGGALRTGGFTVNFIGVAPEFAYQLIPPTGNPSQIFPNDTITFPQTIINQISTATVVIANRGSGSGLVNAITLTAPPTLTVGSLPLLAATVDPGRDIRVAIRYAPTLIEDISGALRIEFIDRAVTFALKAQAIGPVLAYDLVQESGVSTILPGQTITLPDAAVGGETTTITLRVRNTGNADARITTIAAQGTGFTLTEVPFLPLTLTPGQGASFTINFNPTDPGRALGKVRVGDDSFDLTASGLGVTLTYSFVAADVSTTITPGGTVVFPPIPVGGTSSVRFVVSNTGTSNGSITTLGVVTSGAIFTLGALPGLPVQLTPGQTSAFTVSFTPTAVGTITGTLRIDSQTFTLTGVATNPPALPEYRFSGASGTQEPAQQVSVGLALASAYPIPLTGSLTLAFNSDVFANDPSVQFAIGGRTVAFSIAAGTTQAVFPNSQRTIALQTGTVAGTITLTPAFQTSDGLVLTPANPPALNLTVGQSAPRLLNLQVASKTTTGFQLLVTGYATGRSITQIDVTFTPVSGENVATTKLTLNVDSSFTAFYQSTASQVFGSQFTATIPFTLQGDIKNVTSLVDTIQSASVTITNRQGASASRSVDLK